MENRFERALTEKRTVDDDKKTAAERRVKEAEQYAQELIGYLNSDTGFEWLWGKVQDTGNLSYRERLQFTSRFTDGYILILSRQIDPRLPTAHRLGADLRLFLKEEAGDGELFFGERLDVFYPNIDGDSPKGLAYSDRSDPKYQTQAREASLTIAQEKWVIRDLEEGEAFIFTAQDTRHNPFGCMVLRRHTPASLTQRLGPEKVELLCDKFMELISET